MDYVMIYHSKKLLRPHREKSANTISTYMNALRDLDFWLRENHQLSLSDETIKEIKGFILEQYDDYLLNKGYKISTHNLRLAVVKNFFRYLHDSGYISENPSRVLTVIQEKENEEARDTENKCYSPDEIQKMIAVASGTNEQRDKALIALIVGSGLRISEACSLNNSDYWKIKETGCCYVTIKGGRRVKTGFAPWVVPFLDDYVQKKRSHRDVDDPLFITTHGVRLDRKSAYRALSAIEKKAGLTRTGAHILRHTALTAVKKSSGDILAAQTVAHHKSSGITRRYIHEDVDLRNLFDNNSLSPIFE